MYPKIMLHTLRPFRTSSSLYVRGATRSGARYSFPVRQLPGVLFHRFAR